MLHEHTHTHAQTMYTICQVWIIYQRQTNALEQTSQVLFNYAELIKQGISPEEAIMQTAEGLKNTQMGMPPVPQGGVPGAGPEAALMGMENMPL